MVFDIAAVNLDAAAGFRKQVHDRRAVEAGTVCSVRARSPAPADTRSSSSVISTSDDAQVRSAPASPDKPTNMNRSGRMKYSCSSRKPAEAGAGNGQQGRGVIETNFDDTDSGGSTANSASR